MENNIQHKEKDLKIIAYLLTSKEIRMLRTEIEGTTVYVHFVPQDKCLELIDRYFREEPPHISAKRLFECIDDARTLIFRAKDGLKSRSRYDTGFNR